jgi:UDP-N-acetylglucosamine--N-acetylmuramyl-(pentapeptide) pyrophosphoryl-undecaprenol N-acetylglucosamine transferase
LLEKYANEIHISFDYSKKFFRVPKNLKISGNPIRQKLKLQDQKQSLKNFELDLSKKTILILGGSLGAKSINIAIKNNLEKILNYNFQLIWQVGKKYYDEYKYYHSDNCKVLPFIENIEDAYSASDLTIARAGAGTIAEISLLGLCTILIPSPNVAENHQYHNAKALADQNATILIEDKNIETELFDSILKILSDENLQNQLRYNVKTFAKPYASTDIAKSAINYVENNWI